MEQIEHRIKALEDKNKSSRKKSKKNKINEELQLIRSDFAHERLLTEIGPNVDSSFEQINKQVDHYDDQFQSRFQKNGDKRFTIRKRSPISSIFGINSNFDTTKNNAYIFSTSKDSVGSKIHNKLKRGKRYLEPLPKYA